MAELLYDGSDLERCTEGERGASRLRVTEHNILVLCKYYTRIRMARLAQLLDLPLADAEKHLSDMVVAGALTAKIDRPAGQRLLPLSSSQA